MDDFGQRIKRAVLVSSPEQRKVLLNAIEETYQTLLIRRFKEILKQSSQEGYWNG